MAAEPDVTETSAYKVKPWKPTELAQVSRAVTHSSRFPPHLKTGIMSNSNTLLLVYSWFSVQEVAFRPQPDLTISSV